MATYTWPRAAPGLRPRAWSGYLVATVVAGVLYFALPPLGAPEWSGAVLYLGICAATPIAIVAGTRRHRPASRRGWRLLAAGQLLITAAEALTYVSEYLAGGFEEPDPSDVLYLSAYPLLALALLTFVRRRTPEWDLASALDATIVAVAAGLACWVFLVHPLATDADSSTVSRVIQGLYPMLDLVLLVITVRMMLGTGVRTPAFGLLVGSVAMLLAADGIWATLSILEVETFVSPLDSLWMASYALMGAAALHPSMRRLDEPSGVATPDASLGRLAILGVAVLVAPGVQVVQDLRGEDVQTPLTAGACAAMLLLVMARMAGMVAAQRRAAITDGLTGLHTRRYFEQCLATEVHRARRTGQPVGLLLVDVDHFKAVNDTYGHPGGDRVLIEVARRLLTSSGEGAVVARFGGEEFALLLPHTGPDGLDTAAERIRRAIGGTPIAVRGETLIRVTVSVGASCLPEHADTPETLVLTADHALYAAKDAGRNRAVVSTAAA
ncbi:GGDEF domain-containing protein [Jidongwangia harbinensis]|uniref:GGDEF domain-containing protein n=1 Tax=Jidongwangia harbinensis TaxID=2878561 RepID=UPI001CD9F71B|nr:GGDEF domain-containing protein [Jidongwangia harbinensis]MCA2214373.1 GGDEF domain-containing protein [Jidongwangia harbinensis]